MIILKNKIILFFIFSTACAMEQSDAIKKPLSTQKKSFVMNKPVASFDPNETETLTGKTFKAIMADSKQNKKPCVLATIQAKKDDGSPAIFFYDGYSLWKKYENKILLYNPANNLEVDASNIKYYVVNNGMLAFVASQRDVILKNNLGYALEALLERCQPNK